MRIDVTTFIGEYPYRHVPGCSPRELLWAMDRTGIDEAWVSHLSAIFWRDPTRANATLYELAEAEPRLHAVPAIHPALPEWEDALGEALFHGVPCIRCDPMYYGLDPLGEPMRVLVGACGGVGVPVMLTVRLEDVRQRHPHDRVGDLTPAVVRKLIRSDDRTRLILTHADREFVEQVHFGSTPDEAERMLWDINWIWGPPEDHLALLLRTVGLKRFTFGTGMPLRIPEAGVAKVDLLDLSPDDRAALESGNLRAFLAD